MTGFLTGGGGGYLSLETTLKYQYIVTVHTFVSKITLKSLFADC